MARAMFVFGTRPEIIKLCELVALSKKSKRLEAILVHTGQHYDYEMNDVFLKELNLPRADEHLKIGSTPLQAIKMLSGLEKMIKKHSPDLMIVQGDTNTSPATALAAARLGVPVAHVEAGLRCFECIPEEINRIVADHNSQLLFAPTRVSKKNLFSEGIKRGVHVTGNTIVEVCSKNVEKARMFSRILEQLELHEEYAVLTAHRQENVDNKQRLSNILAAVKQFGKKTIFPVHPRTLASLKKFNLLKRAQSIKALTMIPPLGYFDFLHLCANSSLLMTDSGGIQEECTVYKKPCVVIRDSTERPEALGTFSILTGTNPALILRAACALYKKDVSKHACPFGDGNASQRQLNIIKKFLS